MKKKIIIRLVAAVMMVAMILPMAAGCKNDSDDLFAAPEFVFIPEFISLPDEIGDLGGRGGLVYIDGKIIFTSAVRDYEDGRNSYITELYSINLDGTGYGKLPDYVPPVSLTIDATNRYLHIEGMNIDGAGNLWIIENWSFYNENIPDNFDWNQPFNYTDFIEDLGSGNALRKLDRNGKELLSLDISSLSSGSGDEYDYFQIYTFNTDAEDNIYLAAYTMDGMQIIVLDSSGNLQFRLSTDRWIERFIRLSDGTIVYMTDDYNNVTSEYRRILQTIDLQASELGEAIEIPTNIWNIYPATGEYDFLYSDSNNIRGFNVESGESTRLLNWLDSDVAGEMIENITMLPDGRILVTNGKWNRVTYEISYELIILTKTPYSELPQKTIISLATFGAWGIREAVVQFNRTNPDYRIRVVDYTDFATDDDWSAGLTRLSTEIISGRVPDIIEVSALPYKQYVGRNLLENIYTLIDADPNINRSDFMEGAFRAAEIDGGLYQVFPSFSINTLIGSPSVLGPNIGWTMDEFKAILAVNPQADFPLGNNYTRMSFIHQAIRFSADEYVNWTNGTTHFDSPNFVSLLEFANTLPENFNWDDGFARNDIAIATPAPDNVWVSEEELIASGRQLMSQIWLGDVNNFQWYKQLYGGDVVFKGFPTDSRNGNSLDVNTSLAIAANSKNKDGAWEFLKVFLDKDWQLNNSWGFLTNRAAFDAMVERSIKEQTESYENWLQWYNPDDEWGWKQPPPLTQADINQLLTLIESTSGTTSWNIDQSLLEIVTEGAEDFFNNVRSAADAARIIQSRASILVSERS